MVRHLALLHHAARSTSLLLCLFWPLLPFDLTERIAGAAESIPPEVLEIEEGGYRRRFEVSTNEVWGRGPGGERRLQTVNQPLRSPPVIHDPGTNPRGVEGEHGLILYEKGRPRNDSTRRILTRQILVRLEPQADAAGEARDVHAISIRELPYAPGHFIFESTDSRGAWRIAEALRGRPGVLAAEPILGRQQTRKLVPNDPFFGNQWHLLNRDKTGSAAGVDLNVTNVWEKYRGQGINIAVVDDGVEMSHPDLLANIQPTLGYDYRDGDADASSGGNDDFHGTQVAGVAAARGNNALGVVGVAFEAGLAAIRLVGGLDQTDVQNASAMLHQNQAIQISNNSWGAVDDGLTLDGPGRLMKLALETGTRTGREGRGTIFVWPGGNGGQTQDNANYDGYANSIHTIAVAALNHQGQKASYSEPGACLVLAAPSGLEENGLQGGIVTTDLTGEGGQNHGQAFQDLPDKDYTDYFGGTSAVTPMVSGVAALMLQANPNLGWRDVQEILIRSAVAVDPTDSDWMTNGSGLHFNHKFGAGMVDAAAAVKLAERWVNLARQTNLFLEQTNLTELIPDNNPNGLTRVFDLSHVAPVRVEHVTVSVNITHTRRGDLAVTLVSPAGTRSRLAEKHLDSNENYRDWTFMSVFHWGESSQGQWKVEIADLRLNRPGTLHSIQLQIFGARGGVEARPAFTPGGYANGIFRMLLSNLSTESQPVPYDIQVSPDLANWSLLLQTNVASGQTIELLDPGASGPSPRFYRAIRQTASP